MLRSIDTTTKSGKKFQSLLLKEIEKLERYEIDVSQKKKKKFNIFKKIKEVIF